MKSADDFAKLFKLHSCVGNKKFETQVKQIQLDAYKSGMTEAITIMENSELQTDDGYKAYKQMKQAILSARNKKETI